MQIPLLVLEDYYIHGSCIHQAFSQAVVIFEVLPLNSQTGNCHFGYNFNICAETAAESHLRKEMQARFFDHCSFVCMYIVSALREE